MELHEKFLAKRLALSVDFARTSGPLKRYGRPPNIAVANPPEVTRSDNLRCNRAKVVSA